MFKMSILLIFLLVGSLSNLNEATEKTISQELKSTPDGQLFYVELKVGEGSEQQTFNLLVSTTFYITWLPSLEVNPNRGYPYREALSVGEDYLLKTGTGYGGHIFRIYSDTVEIGDQVVANQKFAVVYPRGGFEGDFSAESKLDGMLGLSGYETRPPGVDYLFKNLFKSGLIDRMKFSLYINNSAIIDNNAEDQPKGALVFGGVDEKYYSGDINYAKMYEDNSSFLYLLIHKTLVISSIQLDWSRINNGTRTTLELPALLRSGRVDLDLRPSRLRLDSSTKLFIGDKKVLDKIHLDFIGANSIGQKGLYVFNDCSLDNKPDFVFTVDGLEFMITPEEYVIHGQIENNTLCLSAFKPFDDYRVWVFGTRFLRKHYTVFDFENDLVGFATPK